MTLDGSPAQEPERATLAESLFAAWLFDHPRPSPVEFARLRDGNPGVAAELDRLWRGLEQYERLRGGLVDRRPLAAAAPSSGRRRWMGLAAAVAAVGGSVAFACYRQAELERAHRWVELSREVAAQAECFSDELSDSAAQVVLGELPPSPMTLPAESIEAMNLRLAESAALLEGAATLSDEVRDRLFVRPADRAVAAETARACARLRDEVLTSTKPAHRALRSAMGRSASVSFEGSPFPFALKQQPGFWRAMQDPAVRQGLPAELATVVAAASESDSIELHAYDLEAGGEELFGAEVWIQEVKFPTNDLHRASQVGSTPWTGAIVPGDWRITIVDGAQHRHSELRVLALPGEDLGRRVAFLRSTERVVATMAHKPAARIKHGKADGSRTRVPEAAVDADIDELWVDPYEASNDRWAAFWRELDANRSRWFDGAVPVVRPAFLTADGACPPEIAHHPAHGMPWDEAILFANWDGKRLPTDAEWDRIAGGPESRRYAWGDEFRADAVDVSLSLEERLRALKTQGESLAVTPTPLEQITSARVDDGAFAAGATPESDGGRVYRLGDNVTEYTEDLLISCRKAGSFEYGAEGFLSRVARGATWKTAGSEGSLNQNWWGVVVTRGSASSSVGLRCVKGSLPTFAR